MKSDESIGPPQHFSSVHLKKSEAEPSCVSMRSDASMDSPLNFKSDDTRSNLQHRSVTKPVCEKYDQPVNQPQDSMYPGVSHEVLNTFRSNLLKKFGRLTTVPPIREEPQFLQAHNKR
ncbi:hypothetical protein G5714_013839 [Onychostoma macrolepis]|uniref:Uncharacterized protein n=1 Tax=Onychostoma macrolepis TaxID=369639 RepID=A0A7J6CFU8_9TELE|nr:hypothetical protein G5714_013839 [Onychostoma macrolepis]